MDTSSGFAYSPVRLGASSFSEAGRE